MKLRQLGDHINISNLERIEDLNETLVKKVLRKLDLAIIMAEWKYNFLQKLPDFIQSMQKLIDLLLIVLSWKFEKLMELPSEHQHHKDIEAEFDSIIDMVNQMIRLIYECKDVNLVDLKTLLAIKYVDLLTFFRIFYVKFNQDNQFENFQSFYSSNLQLLMIRRDLQNELLELFLIKEVRLAHELNVDLDRGDEEDVNYDDYLELPPSEIEVSIFDEENAALESEGSSRPSTAQNAERAWLYEKELSVYSLKLISLVNLSLLHDDIYSRIRLNADKLGGIFGTIITRQDEHIAKIKEKQQLQPEPESELATIADEQQPETIQEEIEV
ncbi:uncharacterized protein SPAPADRAFT_61697 [Spathaspora passalidarum NRRL Y-27907]|uniref:Cohesin subunit SCC3 C-terminal domain-containing protein n=1 Tax=Spathaspora passalidarum (strain NRRL Y-27907 / 11-Y1) TaxID=619300 RepID=G3AP64_SPAPN|nr:uncharacterized protein SPAPADRAFT_61697 [Spathaspora passalidarum NRRL Y-27907]EGW32635.1 hypothetical protein SPAPADRAFT_61697 [Spathaspora passalidarum NRRL Y-27907]